MEQKLRFVMLLVITMLRMTQCNILVFPYHAPRLIREEYRDMAASFGPPIPDDGLRAFLVVGEPLDGCKINQTPPFEVDNFTKRWAVLVARYNCSFEEKVRSAQDVGFSAVIVFNVGSNELETMSAKNASGIFIPSVFVGEDDGNEMAALFTYDKGYYLVLDGDSGFNINTHLLLPFAIIVGLCLIVMIVFMIVKCIKDRRRARRHRLPYGSLKKIPTCKYSKGDPYDTCAICLDDYLEGDKLRVLPCAHAYHCKCIDPWLTKNRRVCPVCKRRVVGAGERRGSSSSAESEPLVQGDNVAGGGTFAPQRENPFARAARLLSRRPPSAGLSAPPAPQENATAPQQENETRQEHAENRAESGAGGYQRIGDDDAVQTNGSDAPTNARRGFVPFLSGVLNMRRNHFTRNESSTDDTEPLIASGSSSVGQEASQQNEAPQSRRKNRFRRKRSASENAARGNVTTSTRSNLTESEGQRPRGEIGVVALPNEQLVRPNNNNDHFIV